VTDDDDDDDDDDNDMYIYTLPVFEASKLGFCEIMVGHF
jgi:hypothetical protein